MISIWNTIYVSIFFLVFSCNGVSNNDNNKNTMIGKIIQKIFNVTSYAFKNADADKRDVMMRRIEQKLIKSTEPLGRTSKTDKYIKLIMQGIKIMLHNQTEKQDELSTVDVGKLSNQRRTNVSKSTLDSNTKDKAQELADNILNLTQKYFNRFDKSEGLKLKMMNNIKDKVLDTAKQKHNLIHVKHDEIKKYTDLISRGMELMMKNMTQGQKSRRMVMEFVNGKPKNGREEYQMRNAKVDGFDLLYKEHVENFVVPTKAMIIREDGLTTPLSCDNIFYKTCADIKTLNAFVCTDNGVTLPLNHLCNGVQDCADGSDEGNCVNQALDRLQSATSLMSRLENFLLRKCYLTDDNSLLIKQNTVLYEVLQQQIGFINKYKNMNREKLEFTNVFSFKRTLNEVIMVIITLASALDSSLCIRFMNEKKAEHDTRKYIPLEIDDLDELTEKPVHMVSLKSCTCSGSFCAGGSCPEACSRVCWHKHNLGRWLCQAIDQGTSVPLDMVCDGKLDCYDETDEIDCKTGVSIAKFEANDVFGHVLKMITMKSNHEEYSAVKTKLIALGNSIMQLQKVATNPKVDVHNIKSVRDICYASLNAIYEDLVNQANDINELEDKHLFLLTVSERIISALKQLHTGNDRILTPDGCYCRRDRCAATKCTSSCNRACAVTSKLTRYWCKATVNNNISIPIDGLCNGKPNCPFEDDESHCIYDVCRKHHLLLLRHNIRDVGEKHKGTALGETLRAWKTKLTATLKVAETHYRPSPSTIRELVGDSLHDLVIMYASMNETRRSNGGYVLKEFQDVSQKLIENVKVCGK